MFVGAFPNDLRAGHFNESLAHKLVLLMQKIMVRAKFYIKDDDSNATKTTMDVKENSILNSEVGRQRKN